MAKFVLTAQIQLQAPNNASQVVQQINKQLQGVNIPVSIKAAGSATKQINQLTAATQRASSAADAMGRSFGLAIKRFAAFTIASRAVSLFTNSLAGAIDESIAFQREVIKVSQVTGKSIGELRDLTDTITRLSVGFGTSSKDLLSTATILAQAGIGADDLKVALEALAKTTLAPNFDSITETAEGAVAILAQFGQGVGALEAQLGSVNAVAGAFAVEAEDLISAVRRFGGVFKASGGSLEELLALFTSVRATTRESAESIATGLRTIFTRIQRPQTIEFLRQYGVELLDLEGKFVGPFEASKQLAQALSGLEEGDIKFIKVAEELGGFRQIGKVIPLLQQFSVAQNALNVAQSGSGSLTKDAATAQQALAVQITKVKEEFLSLVRSISESTSFQLFARTALEVASALIKVADSIKPLIPLIGAMVAFKFAKGLGSFASGAGAAIRGLGTLGKNDGGRILGFARGGSVPGVGNQDTVPAMLTPGEFVIRKSSVNKIGADKLAAMNENRYVKGGKAAHIQVDDGAIGGFFLHPQKGADRKINMTPQSAEITNSKVLKELGLGPEKDEGRKQILDNLTTKEQQKILAIGGKDPIKIGKKLNSKKGFSQDVQDRLNSPEVQSKLDAELDAGNKVNKKKVKLTGTGAKGKATITSYFPGGDVNKGGTTGEIAKLVDNVTEKSLRYAVNSASSRIAPLLRNPVIKTDEESMKRAAIDLSKDKTALSTVSGFIFEGLIQAITGAKFAGESANFDFKSSEITKSKKSLTNLFGESTDFTDLKKADAKRTSTPDSISSITKKLASDINLGLTGEEEGVTLKPLAKGGSAGTDTVPALLTPGEFVVNKSSAQRIGYGNLNRMNKQGVAKFAKGGSVGGGWARFETGGDVEAKAKKKQQAVDQAAKKILFGSISGPIINTVKDYNEAFDKAIGPMPQKIKEAILEGLKLGQGNDVGNHYGEGPVVDELKDKETQGIISKRDINGENAFKITTAKGKADEGTVKHEVAHAGDLAAGKIKTGKAKTFASEEKGTFQNNITNKVSEVLKKSMLAAGASAEQIEDYFGKNRELFANFYAESKESTQSILLNIGDADLAMIAMSEELTKTGDGFAGLSASDLRPEIEGIRDAARATRKTLLKQRGELEGQKSTAEGGVVKAVQEQQSIIASRKKAIVGVDTNIASQQSIRSQADVRRTDLLKAQSNQAAKMGSGTDSSKWSKAQKIAADNFNIITKKLEVQDKILADSEKAIKGLDASRKKHQEKIESATKNLTLEQGAISVAIKARDKATKALEENAQAIKAAGDKETKARIALGERQHSPKGRRTVAIATGKDPNSTPPTVISPDISPPTNKEADDSFVKLSVAISSVIGGLSYLRPEIDENSGALAKFADGLVGGLQTLLAGLLAAAAAAQTFGIQLNAQSIKGIGKDLGQFFRGKESRVGSGMKNSIETGFGKAGSMLEKLPGPLGKFGSRITKLGPQLGKLAAGAGPFIATVAVGAVAMHGFNKIVDSLTGVHKKYKNAIEQGNVAAAGEAAVRSKNADAINKFAIGTVVAGAAFGSIFGPIGTVVGGAIGAIVGASLKLLHAFGMLDGVINFIRDTMASLGLGPSTDTVKQEARLAAARKKQENEASKNANDVAMAMQRVESGSSTLTDEFTKGNLTGNLNNEFGALAESIALSNSRIADVNNSFWAMEGASTMAGAAIGIAFGPLGPLVGAFVGSMLQGQLDKSNNEARAEALKGQLPDQEKATTAFMEQLPMFGNVLADQIMRGATADDAKRTVTDNLAYKNATTSQFSQAEKAKIDANVREAQKPGGAGRVFSDLEQQEIKIRGFEKQREEAGKQSLKAAEEQAMRQLALIKATNFGLGTLSDSLDATNKKLSKLLTIDQVGDKFGDSLDILQTALTSAAGTLSANELNGAIATLEGTLRDAGASGAAVDKASGAAKGFNTAFSRLNKDSDSFESIQNRLKEKGPKGATPQEISRILSEELTKELDPEVATRINAGLDEASSKFNGADIAAITEGNFGPLREALQKTSDAFNKEVLGVLQKRSEAEQLLIKGIQQRIASEQEYVAAQRRAIELQLEAGKIFEEFGGKALTAGEKQQARVSSFNVGADAVGVRGLQTGNAGDIQSVSADISNQFLQLEERARAGAVSGERAFSGGAGAEEDTRERLKALQQDLISQTKQEIEARKEELQLIQRKNQAEKDSLESLISGDIEGFLEKQAAAGAGAALASGSSALTSLFSGSALGAGFKTLEGQGLSDDKKRRAEDLTLQRFGVQSTGVLSGTTTEEQAKKAEGRELATTLGQLGQQAAEFERAEVNTKQAIVYAQELTIGDIGKQLNAALGDAAAPAQVPARLYRGGPVYANRGMFVPRGTDTVPAMLTPGEFVVNRSSVQRGNNLQILQAMNKGGGASAPGAMSGGGKARYYNVGGAVDGVGSAFSAAIPQLTTIFNNFAATVDKLIGSKFQVALDTTNINVNFNGASFLETMKEDIKQELLTEVGKQISQFKTNTSGDLKKTNSVLG